MAAQPPSTTVAGSLFTLRELQTALSAHRESLVDGNGNAGNTTRDVETIDRLQKFLQRESGLNREGVRFDISHWQNGQGGIDWPHFLDKAQQEGESFHFRLSRDARNYASYVQQSQLPVWGQIPRGELQEIFEKTGLTLTQHDASINPSAKEHGLKVFLQPSSAVSGDKPFYGHLLWFPQEGLLGIERVDTPTDLQGKGMLRQFLAGTLELANRLGASRIELLAEDAGPIVWGKAGIAIKDKTLTRLDMTGEEFKYLGWEEFCKDVRESVASNLRFKDRWSSASPEKEALLLQIASLAQDGAPKTNLQEIAKLTAEVEKLPGQFLFLKHYGGYFDLHDPVQMQALHQFIGTGARQPSIERLIPEENTGIKQQGAVPVMHDAAKQPPIQIDQPPSSSLSGTQASATSAFIPEPLRGLPSAIDARSTADPETQDLNRRYAEYGEKYRAALAQKISGQTDESTERTLSLSRKMLSALSVGQGANGEASNPEAARVEQGEVGYSARQPIGTDNINDCIGVIIRDPVTHKTAVAHIDGTVDEASYQRILDGMPPRKPGDPQFEVKLIGARFKDGDDTYQPNIDHAKENVQKVMRFLADKDVRIVAADIHNSDKPIAFVVDPETFKVTAAVPTAPYSGNNLTNGRLLFGGDNKPLEIAFDLTLYPGRNPLMLSRQEVANLQPYLGKTADEVSDMLMKDYQKKENFPKPQDWTLDFSQRFAVQVQHTVLLADAYQKSLGEVTAHLDAKIADLGKQGIPISGEDRSAALAAIKSGPLHIGADTKWSNTPLMDFIDDGLFKNERVNLQGVKEVPLRDHVYPPVPRPPTPEEIAYTDRLKSSVPSAEEVQRAIVKGNLLGRGGGASVFTVEGYPDFAIRAPHSVVNEINSGTTALEHGSPPKMVSDPVFQGRNFGQAVADYGNGVTVLFYQQGVPPGVPGPLRKMASQQQANDQLYEKQTALAARMPQQAYVDLLSDMQFVESAGRRIDPSKANNMLIDEANGRFNIVDLNKANYRSGYRNSPGDLLTMLFDNSYMHYYKGDNEAGLQSDRKLVLDKVLSAAEALHIPVKSGAKDMLGDQLALAGYKEGSPERLAVEARIEALGVPQKRVAVAKSKVEAGTIGHENQVRGLSPIDLNTGLIAGLPTLSPTMQHPPISVPTETPKTLSDFINTLDWKPIPQHVRANNFDISSGSMPLLFRGHAFIDPHSVRADYDGVIHATPIFAIATNQMAFKSSRIYKDAPGNVSFMSVYTSHAEQRFFADQEDGLVTTHKTNQGIPLQNIPGQFDSNQHHETAVEKVKGNQLLGTFMVRYKGMNAAEITPVPDDPEFYKLLEASLKVKPGITFQKSETAPVKGSLTADSIFMPQASETPQQPQRQPIAEPDYSLHKPLTPQDASTRRSVGITTYEADGKALHFIGAKHGIDLASPTHQTVEAAIERLKPDLVIIEGVPTSRGLNPPRTIEFARTQLANGSGVPESPYAAHLAQSRGIDFMGGEPPHEQVTRSIMAKGSGYTHEQVMSLNLAHLVVQMKRENKLPPNEAEFAARITELVQGDNPFFKGVPKDERISYDRFKEIITEKLGKPPLQLVNNDLMPLNGPEANFFQKMNHFSGVARDEHILGLIHESLGTHKNVLVVYGDGHLFAQAPVLQKMFGQVGTTATVVPDDIQEAYEIKARTGSHNTQQQQQEHLPDEAAREAARLTQGRQQAEQALVQAKRSASVRVAGDNTPLSPVVAAVVAAQLSTNETPLQKPTVHNASTPLTEHVAQTSPVTSPVPSATNKAASVSHATRAGSAAGGAMGVAAIVGRVENTLVKAAKVGGEQLRTERQALAGDTVSVLTGAADILPKTGSIGSTAVAVMRVAPIVAAGAAYLEVQAANTAQDGRRGSAAIGGFVAGIGTGMASGAAAGSVLGPWGAAIGGIAGGFGAGYVGSEIGRTSQWGDQRQRDLDHKSQASLDRSVEVIGELDRKRQRGEAWNDADKAAVKAIGGLMVEHVNRLQVLDIPATDIDGKLRQNYQLQQAQHVIDYLNGKTERLPMTSQQRDTHLIPSLDALLPALNDAKLGWKPHLDADKSGKVDRVEILQTLQKYGVELHTLDKDGRNGVAIDELTQVLKALKVDQLGRVTPTRGAAHVERLPTITDETHANFRDGLTESSGAGQKRFLEAMASWIPEMEKAGFGKTIGHDGKITVEELSEALKRTGIRASDVDRDGNGNINEREAIAALKAFGLNMSEQTAVAAAPITPVNAESINPRSRN